MDLLEKAFEEIRDYADIEPRFAEHSDIDFYSRLMLTLFMKLGMILSFSDMDVDAIINHNGIYLEDIREFMSEVAAILRPHRKE